MKPDASSSRREFLKGTGVALSAGALAGATIPAVHAGQDSTVQIALVGCGGRGTGAARKARGELFDRIQNGEIGDLIALRCYRMHPPVGSAFSPPRQIWQQMVSTGEGGKKDGPSGGDVSELAFQIRRFHSFLWASGGLYSDFYIHNIDECCWMKNGWPISAQASGGRHYRNHMTPKERGEDIDPNFDSYSVEYTFVDGCKLL